MEINMLERLGHHKAKSFSDIEVGTTVEMSLLLVSATCALTKRNTKYYTLLLRDETEREMQAKVWDEATLPPNMKCASVYDIVANVGVYNGNKQLSVTLMGESELSPSMFAIKPPIKYDDEQLWKELVDIVSSFTEPVAKFLGEELLTDDNLVNEIKTAPAAKSIHNNWVGGLLEHAVALCRLATSSIEQYKRYYPQLSRDKILLGCLIHDLGKIHEFKLNQGNIEYTPFGYLIGHITWGPV